MLDIEDVIHGNYRLRSIANRENGDIDYFIDNFAMPLTLELNNNKIKFKKISSILIRLGNTKVFSLHLLLNRDLLSQVAYLDLNADRIYLKFYKSNDGNMRIKIIEK